MRTSQNGTAARIVALIGLAGGAYGQVVLSPITTPATIGTTIVVQGSKFPAGAIGNSTVAVTITPPPGNGAPVTTSSVGVVAAGTQRLISFTIPGALVVNSPIVCSVSVSGTTGSNNAYTTATPATVTIDPPAAVSNVSPGAGTVGNSVAVAIAGTYTHFSNTSKVTVSGAGVTAANNGATSTQLLQTTFIVAAGATPGARNITITSGTETATIVGGFVVAVSPGLSFSSIAPDSGQLGQTLNVTVTGINTHFAQNTTFVNFGDGITVNLPLTNFTSTSFTANISVSPTTYTGWRMITAVTGGEFAVTGAQGFDVAPSAAALLSVAPNTAPQGANLTNLVVTGLNTHFLQNATTLSLGTGINVGNIKVNSLTSLTANIAVSLAATVGAHDVTVTTGGETETLTGGFGVAPSTAFLSNVTPTSGAQGSSVAVQVTAVNTNFPVGTITADFGSNITTSVVVNNATSLTINASIAQIAATGGRTVILDDNGTDFTFTFTVTPSLAQISNVSPSSGPQGGTPSITVTGLNTHWVQGTTTASIISGQPSLTINRITVNNATSAVLNITIPANALVGSYTLTMATGGELVTSAFSVFANTPTLTVSPGTGQVGTTVPINLTGQFTLFNGTTTINVSGQGVSVAGYDPTKNTAASIAAKLVIDPTAPPGPVTITATTGNEIVTTSFVLTSTPAVLTNITPNHSPQSNTLTVTITGQNTHFGAATTVGFGPDIAVTTPISVDAATQTITAGITVDNSAAYGWRTCFVNTGAEQLQIGFRIDSPGTPVISSVTGAVNPVSGAQGQTITGVVVTGLNTNWVQALPMQPDTGTQLFLGAGVIVPNLVVNSPTMMTADIVISPTAPIGPNSLVAITGSEIASGTGFTVTKGAAQILSISQNMGTQNQTLTEAILGQGTHWVQGETTANFGPDINIDSLTITDATHASAEITILSEAPVGFQTVTLNTDGEIASLSQGLDVVQGTPTLLSSTPNAGLQGETENIQVLGQFTHWVQGMTQAAYSSGIIVNFVTVQDSVTATLNITVNPLAFVDSGVPCRSLTVTTGTEQVALANQFCVSAGPAQITAVNPNSAVQGSAVTVTVTGLNTHWVDSVTSANFGAGINATVHVLNQVSASVDLAVSVNATAGLHTASLTTMGEVSQMANAFTVTPGVPTLNGVSPISALQGTTLTVHIIGQFTHWMQAGTTATFGQGITLNSLSVGADQMSADANITIDPLAFTGPRTVTMTTGSEIVSGSLFSVTPGPAIISAISPSTGNQGQERVITITGQGTHWQEGLTQFSMFGAGLDITVNGFIVNSNTSATADIVISPSATLGARSIYMSTGGEALSDSGAFVITGGVPSITFLSPSSANPGTSSLNVTINGVFTQWDQTTTVDFGPCVTANGPCIALAGYTVNSGTSITAVINIDPTAPVGFNQVTVRTGTQALTSAFQIAPVAGPPVPVISFLNPSVGLPGQTFTTSITGQFTHWDLTTQATFGAGIGVNNFQVVTPTTARANITIDPAATAGVRTVTLTTGTDGEVETASFNVVIATPYISIIDPASALEGETGKNINIIGQYTSWDATTTFNFGAGVNINSFQVLGPAIATANIAVAQLAAVGNRTVIAATGSHLDTGCCFTVAPSLANISSVTPNTAKQNDTPVVAVVGQFTHWDGTTTFTFGGSGISVTNKVLVDATHYTLTLALAPLAGLGAQSLTAVTGGETATLGNAFVVQPGTPLIISSAPPLIRQQNTLNLTVLGQDTSWTQANTTVGFGAGSGISVGLTTVTADGLGITASITAAPTAFPGLRTLSVTTGGQVLTLPNAIQINPGPAVVSQLSSNNGMQGQTSLVVTVTGTNTNFVNGVTTANFGPGITVNSVQVTNATTATANISISPNAATGINSVLLTTLGETAAIANAFTINPGSPAIQFVNPSTGLQGDTNKNITITGGFTHFATGSTAADFGPGIVVNSVTASDLLHATVNITVPPTIATGAHSVTLTTSLSGGGQEIVTANNAFTVNAGPAAISSAVPTNPVTVHQGDTVDSITITGSATHFASGTSTVAFCSGISTNAIQVQSGTTIVATVSVSPSAQIGNCGAAVTTGGEVATGSNLFTILPGVPALTQLSVNSAHEGDTNINVFVTAAFTHFAQGTTTATLGAGVIVNGVTVGGLTSATVNISVTPSAALGMRDVTLTTGAEVVTLSGGFTITAPAAAIVSGLISNPDNSVAANIPVILTPSSGNVQNTTTDATGFYSFSNVANGTFTVLASNSMLGYAGSGTGQVTAQGQNVALNIHMSICSPAPSGINHWWPGEGNAGDVVGTAVGTLSGGVTFAPGKVGQGFSFNGAGLVTVPNTADMSLTALTMEGWIEMYSAPVANNWFVVATKGIAANAENYGLYITDKLELAFEYWNGSTFPQLISPMNVIAPGSFHHVGVTTDGSTVSFYVDGQMVGQVAQPSPLVPNTNPFQIGSAQPAYGNRFNGIIDELSLYNRPLSQTEIQSIFSAGSNGKCSLCIAPPSGLISWWTGDSDATDIIGGNNGTAVGTVVYDQAHVVGKGGFLFNGSSYIKVADAPSLEPAQVTVAAWVQATSPGSFKYILDKGVINSGNGGEYAFYTGGAGLTFYVTTSSGFVFSPSAPASLWNGAFHHIVGTYDGSTIRLFVDGTQVGSGTSSSSASISYAGATDSSLYIGTFGGETGGFTWPGAIDEVQIFNRALTANEILAIYNAGGAGDCRPASGSCLVPPSNLTAWWTEDGTTSDLLGANDPAGANNITFVPGKIGLGAQFGTGSYIDIPPSSSLNNQQFTWSAWARPDGPGPNNDQFGNELFGRENDLSTGYKILWRASDSHFLLLYNASLTIVSTHAFAPGQFYLVNASYDGATFKLYVNGSLEASVAIAELISFNTQTWNIGSTSLLARSVGFPRTWNGVIDEVQVFSRALSLAEIQAIYTAGQAGECKPVISTFIKPVAYSMLNGATDGTIHFWDDTYSGSGSHTTDNAPLSGGLGQLTDGFVGGRPYTEDLGRGPGYEYVGWNTTQPAIVFDFGGSQNFNTVSIHSDSADSDAVLWSGVVIDFSTDGVNFGGAVTYNTSAAQQANPNAGFIVVPAVGAGRYVRLQFTHASWMLISEVQFQ